VRRWIFSGHTIKTIISNMKKICSLLLAGVMGVGASSAWAAGYEAFKLGTLGGDTHAMGLNNRGQVVGWSRAEPIPGQMFTRAFSTGANGQGMINLGTLRQTEISSWSSATAINDLGQVVGMSNTDFGYPDGHAFYMDVPAQGRMTDLGTLGGESSEARSINNLGQIVGKTYTAYDSYRSRGFVLNVNDFVMHDMGDLGGFEAEANDINDNGLVVGSSMAAGHAKRAFVYNTATGEMKNLGTLLFDSEGISINNANAVAGKARYETYWGENHAFTTNADIPVPADVAPTYQGDIHPTAINAQGTIVGYFTARSTSINHAFVVDHADGTLVDLNSLVPLQAGEFFFLATGVNDVGQIVANTNLGNAYLLTPVPEPSTLSLLGLGCLAIVGVRARSSRAHPQP
jgi:probable HAF family extracellular repeat protein